ncbi:MAG: hypothetical protein ACLR3C_01980 [Eggerthella lenta]
MMEAFLTSNEWPWRLARTIVQGVLGVVVANVDMLVAARCWHRVARRGGGARDGRCRR